MTFQVIVVLEGGSAVHGWGSTLKEAASDLQRRLNNFQASTETRLRQIERIKDELCES